MNRLLRVNKFREELNKPEYDHLFDHKDALSYYKGDALAADAFMSKYALKEKNGECLEPTPNFMHIRLADEFARIEAKYPNALNAHQIYELFAGFKYVIPQGSPMFGIGNNTRLSSLGNCFVLGINHDSIPGITLTELQQREAQKLRAGTGEDLSHLRPKGMPVNNAALTSSGLVPFMNNYSESTRTIGQDGRRGALMLTLSDRHPDVFDFINAKKDRNAITGANISVKVSDELMQSAKDGKKFVLKFPINAKEPTVSKIIKAKTLVDNITDNAWESAEPGVLFWDKILRESPADQYPGFETISTNPCGEIPLCLYDSCRLMALNLYSYVIGAFTQEARFDFELFRTHVRLAQRLMDDLIDLEEEKVDLIIKKVYEDYDDELLRSTSLHLWNNIRKKLLQGRRTGLGITAEGDMLAAMGLTYGTPEASDFAEKVHREMALAAYWSSVELAKERGKFELYDFDKDMNSEFIKRICTEDPALASEMQTHGRRNIALMTIAPTGTVSLMAQTSSGIEPVFMIAYKRKRKIDPNNTTAENVITDNVGDKWITYNVVHPHFMTYLRTQNLEIDIDDDAALAAAIEKSPYHKATSNDVDWLEKVRMQGRIQKWVDHSISVTVNLPNNTTKKTVGEIYMTAWENGCKGCTIYRDGSRFGVLVAKDEKKQIKMPTNRPKKLSADVVHFNNNKEKWVAFVGVVDGWPYEIFTGQNSAIDVPNGVKSGFIVKNENGAYDFHYTDKKGEEKQFANLQTCFEKQYWNCAILLSKIMRLGYDLDKLVTLVRQLDFGEDNTVNSWKNGVARALAKYVPAGTKSNKHKCECGENFVYQEGCLTCFNCGNSKCS